MSKVCSVISFVVICLKKKKKLDIGETAIILFIKFL